MRQLQPEVEDLKEVPRDRDLVLDNLETLMGYVNELALENFEDAQRCGDPIIRSSISRFAVKLTESYAKLMTACDKHRKMAGG